MLGNRDAVANIAAKDPGEHYDMLDMKRAGDVHVAGDMKVAWSKDPDGNILTIINR